MNGFCWLWQDGCRFIIDAAWVQAILSAAAIFWASRIATTQAKSQHETAMRQVRQQHELDLELLQKERIERQKAMANVIGERVRNTIGTLNCLLEDLDSAVQNKTRFTEHKEAVYGDMLNDIVADFSTISIFDLADVSLVRDFSVLRSSVKQAVFNYRGLIRHKGFFDQALRNAFYPSIKQALNLLGDYNQKLTIYSE